MKYIKSFILLFVLIVNIGCGDEQDVGDIISTCIYIELVDKDGNNKFDPEKYDLDEFYVAYLKDGEYIRYHRADQAESKGFQFVKKSNTGFDKALKVGVTYMQLWLNVTACGYPDFQSYHESILLDGTFRLEYKDKVFEPIDFVISLEQLEHNKHVNVTEVSGNNIIETIKPEMNSSQFVITLLDK